MFKHLALVFILQTGYLWVAAQSNKFTHALSDYNISIQVDPAKWHRITYKEALASYKQTPTGFETMMKEAKYLAIFLYSPVDSIARDENSITIEVDTLRENSRQVFSFPIRDTIQTNQPVLKDLREKQYYDQVSNAYITKHVLRMVTLGSDKVHPQHYLFTQVKDIGKYRVTIEYRCFVGREEAYFPLFEKVMSSFK